MMKNFFLSVLISITCVDVMAWEPAGDGIMTAWAAEVCPENVRPEYPRPQMVRRDWVNLNGLWDYAIAKSEETQMPEVQGQILVPFCIESSLSGVGKRVAADEALWYRTILSAPAKWEGRRILLHLDAVDWQCEVFVNGSAVAMHKGGYSGFKIDVTKYLAKGDATLELKVVDPTDDDSHPVPHGKQKRKPRGIWYTPVTGIWQTVWMEAVPEKAYIDEYNVIADINAGCFTVTADIVGGKDGDELQVVALRPRIGYSAENPGCPLFSKGRARGAAATPLTLKVRNPKLWSVDSPYLYGLRISLIRNGKIIDRVQGYGALREVSAIKDEFGVKRLALNKKILFQFGPLDQGWWPDGLYTAPTAEAMAFDIEKIKDLGFNMIRKHIKVEPPRWYYDCDRLGMMVWQDMPCIGNYKDRKDWAQGEDIYGAGRDYYAITPEAKKQYYAEWGEILHKFAKFPSIVVWVPFNESWGQFDTKDVCEFTKGMDPTRLVNSASGGNWIRGAGDFLDSHHYNPGPHMRILDTSMVNVLGEYGGIGYPVEGHLWREGSNWGYVKFDTADGLTEKYVEFAKAIRNLKRTDMCAAAVYTQTTDVEGEVNGLYTYDRAVLKVDSERVRRINSDVISAKSDILMIPEKNFQSKIDGAEVSLYTIENGRITMQITNFGARVISLFVPDRNGVRDDIVVGYNDLGRYIHNTGERFFGATVGRVANRIANGTMKVQGETYRLPINNDPNCLHGGFKGVDMVVWDVVEHTDSSLTLHYLAPDGQDGFPGNLDIVLTFSITGEGELDLRYRAVTDRTAPVNLSNHTFFNLKGKRGGTILDHNMIIYADSITPVDSTLIPTGAIMPVDGTPFDFCEPHKIGERIFEDHEQLRFGGGYDHNWVIVSADDTIRKVCEFSEDSTGRVVEIFSDQPGLQFYCGNFFDGSYCGKIPGQPIGFREAIALETQKFPDSVNQPSFPSTLLHPGETYTQHTIYRFSVRTLDPCL